VTGANKTLVNYKESEVLTTKTKVVDISKSISDLKHKNTVGLIEGIELTAKWMKSVYKI